MIISNCSSRVPDGKALGAVGRLSIDTLDLASPPQRREGLPLRCPKREQTNKTKEREKKVKLRGSTVAAVTDVIGWRDVMT